jgi:hypothetical protein
MVQNPRSNPGQLNDPMMVVLPFTLHTIISITIYFTAGLVTCFVPLN